MPVRKIPKNYLGVTGGFSSGKNGCALGFESLLEKDYMILLEFDPEVERFEEQPVRIPVEAKGRRPTSYVPDILVHYRPARNGKVRKARLVEVKKRSDLEKNKEKYAPKFAAAKRYAADRGWEFRVVSDEEIRIPCLPNLKFLREYRLIAPDETQIDAVLDGIKDAGGCVEVQALLDRMHDSDGHKLQTIPVIWHLVACGRLDVDLDQPLTGETVLALPRRGRRQ